MVKVQVKNFQSIKSATVEIEGFTVITGKNNSGKTALQRAVRGVFENTRGHSFVRHGEDNCEVSVSFEDGNKVTWYKGKKENKYVINGKTYDKVGSGTPEPLRDFGVYPITCGGKVISPQIAPQFTGQVFLLNETGAVLAEAVSDVERVSVLNKALKESERDKRSASSELKVRKKDLKGLEESFLFYEGLEDLGDEIDALDSLQKELDQTQEALSELISLRDRYNTSQSIVAHLEGVENLSVPKESLSEISDSVSDIQSFQSRLTRCDKNISLLERILSGVQPYVGVLEESTAGIDRCASGISLLQGYQSRVLSSYSEVASIQQEITSVEAQLEQIAEELQASLEEHSECPLCGGVV